MVITLLYCGYSHVMCVNIYMVVVCMFRWPSADTLVVNVTAHPKQQSLIHLAGLTISPRAVKILTSNNIEKDLQSWDAMDVLFAAGQGFIQQICGDYLHQVLFVHPGNTGHLGHSVRFHF